MKIVIDCRMLNSGGIGTYLQSLLPYFAKENNLILLGNSNLLENYLNYSNIEIINCSIKTFSMKELFFFPKNILKKINSCNIYYSPYCNIPKGIRISIYSTIHDVVFLDVPNLAGKVGTFIRKFFYQRAINKSKAIFTVSEFSKERIIHHLNTKNKQIIVTYNSVPEWFLENANITLPKKEQILFVGNIKKHKGLHTLLPAFKKVLTQFPQTKLLIVGNSQNFRTTDETINKEISNFSDGQIEFTGRITDTQLKEIYMQSKLLIQPSLYEGFGMPPLEALTCGTNVVLSDIPVFKEIYKDFPVIFFSYQDSEDLSQKIISSYNLPSPINLPSVYSFDKTYNIIINSLK